MDTGELRDLHQRVLQGDDSAWRTLFLGSIADLTGFVRSRCGEDSASVQDIVQETFLVAVRRIEDFDPQRATFAAWLTGVARGVLSNHLRQRARRRTEPLLEEPEGRFDFDLAERECVEQVLARLPEEQRSALEARYRERHSVREIAVRMQRSEKAVESLLGRARQRFQELYRSLDPHERSR